MIATCKSSFIRFCKSFMRQPYEYRFRSCSCICRNSTIFQFHLVRTPYESPRYLLIIEASKTYKHTQHCFQIQVPPHCVYVQYIHLYLFPPNPQLATCFPALDFCCSACILCYPASYSRPLPFLFLPVSHNDTPTLFLIIPIYLSVQHKLACYVHGETRAFVHLFTQDLRDPFNDTHAAYLCATSVLNNANHLPKHHGKHYRPTPFNSQIFALCQWTLCHSVSIPKCNCALRPGMEASTKRVVLVSLKMDYYSARAISSSFCNLSEDIGGCTSDRKALNSLRWTNFLFIFSIFLRMLPSHNNSQNSLSIETLSPHSLWKGTALVRNHMPFNSKSFWKSFSVSIF